MLKSIQVAILLTAFTCPHLAYAEIFKCKTAQGKVIYSESPCDNTPSERLEIIDNSLDSSQLRQEARTFTTNRQAGRTNANAAVEEFMSDYDKQKWIKENIIASKALTASKEKKADAEYENNILQQGRVRVLSYEDTIKRSNLKVDLNQLDQAKRLTALRELMGLYAKY